jgi:hypothetical protein
MNANKDFRIDSIYYESVLAPKSKREMMQFTQRRVSRAHARTWHLLINDRNMLGQRSMHGHTMSQASTADGHTMSLHNLNGFGGSPH